jgi:hypothetical protein
MADDTAGAGLSTRDWMLEQVVGDGPALVVAQEHRADDDEIAEQTTAAVDDRDHQDVLDDPPALRDSDSDRVRLHDLDEPSRAGLDEVSGPDINSGAKRTAVWLAAGVLAAAALIVAALVVFGGGPDPVSAQQHHALTPAVAAAPTTTPFPVAQQDQSVPFTARTDSCTPDGGSADQLVARSPQALTDTGTDSAWVCGRGPQESLLDGQILHVQFSCDASRPGSASSYMLNSVSVTPGWVAKTPGGKDEWLQHRVVTRLQFNFFNGNQLVADPFFVDTHSVHGPVTAALPGKVLASRVEVIILHTERSPAAPLPTTTGPSRGPDATEPGPVGGLVDPVVGLDPPQPADPGSLATASDPVDATFAMSQLQFLGHSPS